jgi:hypothetical protein
VVHVVGDAARAAPWTRARCASRGQRQPVALVTAVVAVALAGCASRPVGPAGAAAAVSPADQRLVAAVAALCDARGEARAAVPAARGIFYDRSHEAMHELARRVQAVDRGAAASLLEAKNRVESGFLYPRTWGRVGDDLAALDRAARAALGVIGIAAPAPCPR